MNEIRVSIWNVLRPVLVTGMVVLSAIACDSGSGGSSSTKSSEAKMTALTVTVGDADYTAHISGATATVTLPGSVAMPDSVTVKSVTLSAKATGLAANDRLTLTDGQVGITITAEDGTTGKYTLTVRHSVAAQVLPKGADEYRVHAQAFVLSATEEKEYRLAVRAATKSAPSATELRLSSATLVRTLGPTAIKVIMSFTMETDFFDANTDWDHADYTAGDKAVKSEKVALVLLQPTTGYALYAVEEDGGSDVHKLLDFTTDAAPQSAAPQYAIWYDHFPGEHEFTIRQGEPFLLVQSLYGLTAILDFMSDGSLLATLSNAASDTVVLGPSNTTDFYFSSSMISSPSGTPSATVAMFSKALTPLTKLETKYSNEEEIIHFVTQE